MFSLFFIRKTQDGWQNGIKKQKESIYQATQVINRRENGISNERNNDTSGTASYDEELTRFAGRKCRCTFDGGFELPRRAEPSLYALVLAREVVRKWETPWNRVTKILIQRMARERI